MKLKLCDVKSLRVTRGLLVDACDGLDDPNFVLCDGCDGKACKRREPDVLTLVTHKDLDLLVHEIVLEPHYAARASGIKLTVEKGGKSHEYQAED